VDSPIPRWPDLYIASKPRRNFKVRQGNAAVDITGWTFRADLLLAPESATPLLALAASAFTILAPASAGEVQIAFPDLTEANTGGRDQNRIFRLKMWRPGDDTGGNPREALDFVVAVR
jgi:hypothetical protein